MIKSFKAVLLLIPETALSLSARRITGIQIWTEFACLMGTRLCEREIRALLFSWDFILMLRVEFLRNMVTSFSIPETALLSICLNLCVALLVFWHSQAMVNYRNVRKQASHKNSVSLYFWWRKSHLTNDYI